MRVTTQLAYERAIDAMNDRQARLVRSRGLGDRQAAPVAFRRSDGGCGCRAHALATAPYRDPAADERLRHQYAWSGGIDAVAHHRPDAVAARRLHTGRKRLAVADRPRLARPAVPQLPRGAALANRPDGAGGFVFGGQGTGAEPFSVNGSVTYDDHAWRAAGGTRQRHPDLGRRPYRVHDRADRIGAAQRVRHRRRRAGGARGADQAGGHGRGAVGVGGHRHGARWCSSAAPTSAST